MTHDLECHLTSRISSHTSPAAGGFGDFSAELTLLRGANAPDAVPVAEPRLARAVALAYRLPGPATPEQIRQISENWRPYRTWVTLLLRIQLEDETGEIAGGQAHAKTG